MFNEKGAVRPCNQKSKRMTGLKVEVSARTVGKRDALFIDDCTIFLVAGWPNKGTNGSLVDNF